MLWQRNSFKDAHVCLFVFDCLHYNGETLLDKFVLETFSVGSCCTCSRHFDSLYGKLSPSFDCIKHGNIDWSRES